MSNSILVAYASKYGSTQQVAEAVTATLREHGLAVDLLPASQVRSVEVYRAVVLGAPLIMVHWHKDALHFLTQFQKALVKRPIAIFALGPVTAGAEKEFTTAHEQLDKELAPFAWLRPIAVEIFGGKFDPSKLGFPLTLLPAVRNMPASDLRDWAAINRWADDLIVKFDSAAAQPTSTQL